MPEVYDSVESIPFPALEDAIRFLIQANPKFVYPSHGDDEGRLPDCFYTPDHPGNRHGKRCIIGAAWNLLGVPDGTLTAREGEPVSWIVGHSYTEAQVNWLTVIQDHQDQRSTWIHALRSADFIDPLEESDVH